MATGTSNPTNAQVQIADSLPTSDMSDTQLIQWMAANQGKVVFKQDGTQKSIPWGKNAGEIRGWINNDDGILNKVQLNNPTSNAGTTTATAAAPAAAATGTSPSYLNPSGQTGSGQTGSGSMTWDDIGNAGYSASDIASFQAQGWTADQVMNSIQTGSASAPTPQQDAFGVTRTQTPGKNYTTLTTASGQTVNMDNAGNYFTTDANGNNTPVTDQQAQQMGFQSTNPETQALKQLGQIDPTSEALRTSLGKSYSDQLAEASNPQASQYQSYLDLFKQVDPEEYAQRQGLATSMDSYLKSAQDQYALGSQLDPVTQMQVEQQARKGQADRGNLYGSGQAAVEAMTTGQAGQALLQQRMQNLSGALGQQQGYLGAGLGLGDTALQLYQQGLANKSSAQQGGMSYLSSGQTPYQAGATYLANAEGTAANASQGGPVYNPASLGTGVGGTSQQAPQYGLAVGDQSQNYFNSLNNAYGGGSSGSTKNKAVSAGTGALSGAMAGATAGSVVPGYGTAIGAVVGGVAGGLGGYYS